MLTRILIFKPTSVVEGIIDKEKQNVLQDCLVGWCKRLMKVADIANHLLSDGVSVLSNFDYEDGRVKDFDKFYEYETMMKIKSEKAPTVK
ncbi:hypothetical protein V6N13_043888 [Hibiscus sabdariffa]